MSDTRDEEQEQRWRERQDTRSRCVARHPRSNCNIIYNTGNILNSIIPVLYQCIVTCMHEINYAIVLRIVLYPWYQHYYNMLVSDKGKTAYKVR
jgi:hypothetical protein